MREGCEEGRGWEGVANGTSSKSARKRASNRCIVLLSPGRSKSSMGKGRHPSLRVEAGEGHRTGSLW